MNLESVKEESREIFIEFTNGMCEAMALGKKTLTSIVNDAMRLQWMGGMIKVTVGEEAASIVKYGYLYNGFAVADVRNICAANAHVPSMVEFNALIDYLGGDTVAGGKLKEIGIEDWDTPNAGATNEVGFNAGGAGYRPDEFSGLMSGANYWTSDTGRVLTLYYNLGTCDITNNYLTDGCSLRLIIDTPVEISGNSAIYVGNDLRRYNCVLIDEVWYLSENLAETKFRNGNLITKVTDGTAWVLLETEGYCAYDNDEGNTFSIIPATSGGDVVDSIDNDTPTLAIEKLRHYRGKFKNVDLSQIGVVPNPSDPGQDLSDLLRSGSQEAVIGANAIVFSSPLGTDEYTVNVWIIGDGESQYDLGEITKAEVGFTVSDALIEGTLHYQVIVVI